MIGRITKTDTFEDHLKLEGLLTDAITELQEILEKIPEDQRATAELKLEVDPDDRYVRAWVTIKRPETDEEYAKRTQTDAHYAERQRNAELETLARLKAKYEGGA